MFVDANKILLYTASIINDEQRSVLAQSFANEPYPSKDTCQKLSEQLGLRKATVNNWFKWERVRTKKIKHQKLPKSKFICITKLMELIKIINNFYSSELLSHRQI